MDYTCRKQEKNKYKKGENNKSTTNNTRQEGCERGNLPFALSQVLFHKGSEVVHEKLSCAFPILPVGKLDHTCHNECDFWTPQF
jgi:hypothetical protein